MDQSSFQSKMDQVMDPYYDREFFTNLIFCIDRRCSLREVFESALRSLNQSSHWNSELNRGFYNILVSFLAAGQMRENYQWLSLTNALYGLTIYRGNGQKPLELQELAGSQPSASSLDSFKSMIRREVRAVEPRERAWTSFLFLVDQRSMRPETISSLLQEAVATCRPLEFAILVKGFEAALAAGWKNSAITLRKPFEMFWASRETHPHLVRAQALVSSGGLSFGDGLSSVSTAVESEFWRRLREEGPESTWAYLRELSTQGLSQEQAFCLLSLVRGRGLYEMKAEQWARMTDSVLWGEALVSASQFSLGGVDLWLALNILEASETLRLLPQNLITRPTGDKVLDGVSLTISKDRLILRLDDVVEQGKQEEALELLAVILQDAGLSRTLTDRLLLMAAKQDSWSFDFKVFPMAFILTSAFQRALRIGLNGSLSRDALYGLLRWLSDVREISMRIVKQTGTYGDGMSLSQYDVSDGARIVDRFVFNQMRNAQRVKVWPSDDF